MEWYQVLTIIVTLLGGIAYLHKEIKSFRQDTREDIHQQGLRLDQQAARTDRLYEMFISLIKNKNTP